MIYEQERTNSLFNQEVADVSSNIEGMVIVLYGTNRQLKVISTESWLHDKVGGKMSWLYNPIRKMSQGDIWTPRIPVRRMQQSLIVAQDRGNIGACIRLLRAAYFNTQSSDFLEEVGDFKQREGDIARYLGLEAGARSKLAFLDDTDILYLIPDYYPKEANNNEQQVSSQDADSYLKDLLRE